jgi:hypothetical protein
VYGPLGDYTVDVKEAERSESPSGAPKPRKISVGRDLFFWLFLPVAGLYVLNGIMGVMAEYWEMWLLVGALVLLQRRRPSKLAKSLIYGLLIWQGMTTGINSYGFHEYHQGGGLYTNSIIYRDSMERASAAFEYAWYVDPLDYYAGWYAADANEILGRASESRFYIEVLQRVYPWTKVNLPERKE